MKRHFPSVALTVAVITCATLAFAAPPGTLTIELPAETAAYKPGKNVALAQTFCLNCHSADYTAMQPPMPKKFWEATVKKMKEKYAAPLPADTTALVDYLTATYGKP
jgi:cytochrome c553